VVSQALQKAGEENQRLTNRIKELELRVAQLEGTSSVAKTLSNAKMMDAVVNDAIFSE
jgi:cell division septum initiation protein DivIVA